MSESKFKQIAQTIESRIQEGRYPPNTKLPPHRILAEELKTTPVTVAKAYKQLAEQNKVESFVGRGTFVCGESKLSQAITPADDDNIFNFSIIQPCLNQHVFPLQDAFRSAANKINSQLIGYAEHSGHPNHRKIGVQWAKNYGLTGGNTQNTLLTDGAQHALSVLVESLTKPGDTIAVEAQTYPGILALASLQRRNIVGVEMDEDGMNPDHLQATIEHHHPKLVIVIPSYQNPTGITMSVKRREAIAKIIKHAQVWLVEDDIYGFLHSDPLPAICNWLPDHGFHVTSLSKAISPAFRCGFIKAPTHQVTTLNAHIRTSIWLSSPFNYMIAAELMDSGQIFELAAQQGQIAQKRQAIAHKMLSLKQPLQAGYHLWLPLPAQWQQEQFVTEAKHQNILVSSGSYFDTQHITNHIRLSLMSINTETQFKAGLNHLKRLLDSNATHRCP